MPQPSVCGIDVNVSFRCISNVTLSIWSTSPRTSVSKSSTTIDLSISKSSHTSVAELHKAKYAKNLLGFIPPLSLISSTVNPHIIFFCMALYLSSRMKTALLVLICPADAVKNIYLFSSKINPSLTRLSNT